MKIGIAKIKENDPLGVENKETFLQFTVTKPIVIQPSEIMKVSINAVLKLEKDTVLFISTAPELSSKVCELFPGLITLNNSLEEIILDLPIRNAGRNQVNLFTGDAIAKGYLIPVESLETIEFQSEISNPDRPKTKPQKLNSEIKFEVK